MTLDLNSPEIAGLIDHTHEAAARDAHDAAATRARAAQADLADAQAKVRRAKLASAEADAGRGGVSPLDAQHLVEAAERELAVAERVAVAAERARVETNAAIATARGVGHQPAYLYALRARFQAARRTHDLKLALIEAQATYTDANRLLNECTSAGTGNLCGHDRAHDAGRLVRDLPDERARWADAFLRPSWLSDADKAELLAVLEG